MLSFLSVLYLAAQPFLEGLLCNIFPVVRVKESLSMSTLVCFPGRGTRCSLPQPIPAQPPALKAHRAGVSEQLFLGPGSGPVSQGWAPPPSILLLKQQSRRQCLQLLLSLEKIRLCIQVD